ncbi:high affinity cationic amino acid transporter 1 [Clonorchis sinensis]|uniref:High affinity cationic amino acid transporter 1 n=1 Tax=Clonorchis sinensis TaxID=79923 RepID=H2KUI1_CLOSI|nr:high affinity cationic amino acid transporter 1 [Clonorchis sinensis]
MVYERISLQEFCRRAGRRKRVLTATALDTPLRRCLDIPHLSFFCISYVIGYGLYVFTGSLIRDFTGPATGLACLVSVIPTIMTASCYAEFSTLFPRSGSVYLYSYLLFGELIAFTSAWAMLAGMCAAVSTVAKLFSNTVNVLCDNQIRFWSENHLVTLNASRFIERKPDLTAAAFIILLGLINLTGAKISLTINAVFCGLQLMCLVVMLIACFALGDGKNYSESFLPQGLGGFFGGTAMALFGLSGFESLANLSEEAKNPRRDLPVAFLISIGVCTIIHVTASFGLAYLVPTEVLSEDLSFINAFKQPHNPVLLVIAVIATVLGTGATKLVVMYTVPRILYAVADDGLLFKFLSIINKRTRIPMWSVLMGSVPSILLAVFVKIVCLYEVMKIFTLFCYILVSLNLMVIRYVPNEDVAYLEEHDLDHCGTGVGNEVHMRIHLPNSLAWLQSRSSFTYLLIGFTASALMLGIVVSINVVRFHVALWIIPAILCGLVVVTFLVLCTYKPKSFIGGFRTPLMPVAPCGAIIANVLLMTRMGADAWGQFAVWSLIGLVFYFTYGIWFSEADSKKDSVLPSPETHDLTDVNL